MFYKSILVSLLALAAPILATPLDERQFVTVQTANVSLPSVFSTKATAHMNPV